MKSLSSQELLFHLTQKLISAARLKKWTVIVQEDFNRPLRYAKSLPALGTWMSTNQLSSPDFEHMKPQPGYHTFNSSEGISQNETSIDHSMHTRLPTDIVPP